MWAQFSQFSITTENIYRKSHTNYLSHMHCCNMIHRNNNIYSCTYISPPYLFTTHDCKTMLTITPEI